MTRKGALGDKPNVLAYMIWRTKCADKVRRNPVRFLYPETSSQGISCDFKYSCEDEDVSEVKIECVSSDKGERLVPLSVQFGKQRTTRRIQKRCKQCACKEHSRIGDYAEQIARGDVALLIKGGVVAAEVLWRKHDSEKFRSVRRRSVCKIQADDNDDYRRAYAHDNPLLMFGFFCCKFDDCIQ